MSHRLHQISLTCFVLLAIVSFSALHRIGLIRILLILGFAVVGLVTAAASRELHTNKPTGDTP